MKDKIDRLLDAIENPEQLSDKELDSLLYEPESRALYDLMSKTADALSETSDPDIEAEWQKLTRDITKQKVRPHRFTISVLRCNAAAAIICVVVSLAAVATAIGIKQSLERREKSVTYLETGQPMTLSAVDRVVKTDMDTIPNTTIEGPETTIFKDESLDRIMSEIGEYYHVRVIFRNTSRKHLYLYFQWNRTLPLPDIVEQLNNFEQINIKHTNNGLIID